MTQYLEFVEYAIVEISNNKTPIFEIIDSFLKKKDNIFCKILSELKSQLKSNLLDTSYLPKDCLMVDKDKIKLLICDISSIGKYDSLTEVNKLKTLKERVGADKQKAVNKYKKDGVMAFKLSILLGLAIMIIFA